MKSTSPYFFVGDFVPKPLPKALPLESATFEKVDKTFVRICDSKFF